MTEQNNLDLELNTLAESEDIGIDPALLDTVEVQIEPIAQRKRRISAKLLIPHPIEPIWRVLTNYEALADFIPNLAISRRIEHPTGGIRLEQVGTQRLLRFNFSARVVLDLEEKFPHEINFNLVEGDLKDFSGAWRLESDAQSNQFATNLSYTVCVLPKRTMPVAIIERRLSNDLRINLLAVRQRVNELFAAS
ncbi:SRPBCC family protein [Aliterella atlantica]|uniref:Cyclase n=1 Tax=Aliterella atlantica CENA595 TaxID=1618023 RepID=A0A0D8ZT96_9CYAN|nr:SRPBCC family protein [Aliterella atlantica]KJH71602.1 cyclase [Aliterella atlantica CENA595]